MKFASEKNISKPGARNLNKTRTTTSESMKVLLDDLMKVKKYYSSTKKYIQNVLIDVCYNDIIAKSGRMSDF